MINSVRRTRLGLLICAFVFVSVAGCGDAFQAMQKNFKQHGASAIKTASSDNLRAGFEAANKLCPRKYDQYTTLVSVEMIDEQRVEYRYVINDGGKKLAKRIDKQAVRAAWVKSMQGNPLAAAIAERDITIEHIYQDSRGGLIFAYKVDRAVLAGDSSLVGTQQSNPLVVTNVKNTTTAQSDLPTDSNLSGVKPDKSDSGKDIANNSTLTKQADSMPKAMRWTARKNRSEAVQQNPFATQTSDSPTKDGL